VSASLIKISIYESDGASGGPAEFTLFGRTVNVEGAADVQLPERFRAAINEIAAFLEDDGASAAEAANVTEAERIADQKSILEAARQARVDREANPPSSVRARTQA
jgi:hypothetical protein